MSRHTRDKWTEVERRLIRVMPGHSKRFPLTLYFCLILNKNIYKIMTHKNSCVNSIMKFLYFEIIK